MVRTRGDKCSVRVAVSKTPVAVAKAGRSGSSSGASSSSSSPSSNKSSKYAGGNSYCPRPTPDWQKPINGFFTPATDNDESSSKTSVIKNNASGSTITEDDSNSD